MTDWLILRTKGRYTLPLAQSLAAAGFSVWTPRTHIRKRAPRTNDRTEQPAPLLPTYVFAHARHLWTLVDLAEETTKPQPDFSVFHYLDRIPLIADIELDPLRISEARRTHRQRERERREYNSGDEVSVTDGPWVGLSGIVEHPQGHYTMVLFGRTSVRVATFLLHPVGERVAA